MKRTNMKENLLNPLNPLTILGFFRGVATRNTKHAERASSCVAHFAMT